MKVELNQLPSLITGRFAHACGSYLVANTMVYESYILCLFCLKPSYVLCQMLIVTGGNNGVERLASTEVDYTYFVFLQLLALHSSVQLCIILPGDGVFCCRRRKNMEGGQLVQNKSHSNECKVYHQLSFQVEALPSPRSYANGAKLGGIFHLTGFSVNI